MASTRPGSTVIGCHAVRAGVAGDGEGAVSTDATDVGGARSGTTVRRGSPKILLEQGECCAHAVTAKVGRRASSTGWPVTMPTERTDVAPVISE